MAVKVEDDDRDVVGADGRDWREDGDAEGTGWDEAVDEAIIGIPCLERLLCNPELPLAEYEPETGNALEFSICVW